MFEPIASDFSKMKKGFIIQTGLDVNGVGNVTISTPSFKIHN